jgi:dihydrofolate synthase/folylpolyglutamate synthase
MPVASMDFRTALRDLDARQPESMPERGLERIQAMADLLDHPELTYPSIQVTGTNGKTTTARIVTAVACAHGLSCGTFLSPHVESVRERLGLCGEMISEQEFAETYAHLLPFLERVDGPGFRVTYFETLTALAYLWFADKPVDLAVFEVGMGGTWDATNLVRGEVAVLCPVGIDHKELGSTVAEVASEKAGIIKEGGIAVVREQRPEALSVIEHRCKEVNAELVLELQDFELLSRHQAVGGQAISVRGRYRIYEDLFIPLFGEELARNAAASVAAVESFFGRALDERAVRTGLATVTSPGRLEVVGRRPLVVLDGAHNPDAAAALSEALPDAFQWDRLHLVIGMFRDKDVEAVVRLVAPVADRAYAAMTSSPRAAPLDRLEKALRHAGLHEVEGFGTVPAAVRAAQAAAGEDDLILVTGSFYTVGDARPLFTTG